MTGSVSVQGMAEGGGPSAWPVCRSPDEPSHLKPADPTRQQAEYQGESAESCIRSYISGLSCMVLHDVDVVLVRPSRIEH